MTEAAKNRQAAVDGHNHFRSITETDWPDSSPSKYEERMLSIVVGNTSLKWAIHTGAEGDFLPILFWRYVDCLLYIVVACYLSCMF